MKKVIVISFAVLLKIVGPAFPQDKKGVMEKSDSLFAFGVELYNVGKYEEALSIFAECDKIDKTELDPTSNRRYYSVMWMASCYHKLGNDTLARKFSEKYFMIEPIDRRLTIASDSLAELSAMFLKEGDIEEALSYAFRCGEIEKNVLGEESIWYANTLGNISVLHAKLGNIAEAILVDTKALEIRERVMGTKHPDYVSTLNSIAKYNAQLGNYVEAVRLKKGVLEICEDTLGVDNSNCASILDDLAYYNSNIGNYTEAVYLASRATKLWKEFIGEEHPDYALSLNNLAFYNARIGNYLEAIRLCTEVLEIRGKTLGRDHPLYALSLNNLAYYNHYVGNHIVAVRLETEALDILEKVLGENHPDYVKTLSNLSTYNANIGNYAEALRLATKEMEIKEKVYGKDSPDYATILSNSAGYNNELGNNAEAIRLGNQAMEIRKKMGRNDPDYAVTLCNLAGYYANDCNYAEAVRLSAKALKIYEKAGVKKDYIYAITSGNIVSYYFKEGKYKKASKLCSKTLEIWNEITEKTHYGYADFLSNVAFWNMYLYRGKNIDVILQLETQALRIMEESYRKNPRYAMTLGNLALYSYIMGDYEVSANYVLRATYAYSPIIRNTFGDLTSNERRMFWNKYKLWFEEYLPFYTFYVGGESLAETAYDGTLISKGLLLNSEIEMNMLLLESGDTTAVQKYNELQANRMMLNKLYEKPIAERYMDTDSLESIVQKQEQELVLISKTYGDYTKNLSIDWRNVRDNLGDKDVAIEFIKFNAMNDSVMYVALTLTKNDSCPRMIPIFEKSELDGVNGRYSQKTSELVWKPLAEVIEGKRNIYFSPAGDLHNIAIESLPCFDEDGYMSDKWNIYRLSSTRELALEKDRYSMKEACIYGDLRYNMGVDGLIANSEKYEDTKRGVDWETVDIADSLGFRGSRLDPLPATRHEIESVDMALREQHVNTTLLTDTIGTETSFKALSGKNMNVLHLATHGFYWTESKVESTDARRIKTLMEADMGPTYMEDKAMTRSGLFFAGAQSALDGEEIPENVDDGILTAKEISMLDLRGLDLLVLSACDTGLGDITGDGVFGLQRGFKKAGAQTIVMSLADVEDKPTEIFMTRFYTNLKEGMPKYEAFKEAQRYLRDYKGEGQTDTEKLPYAEPQYWAPFIILDATD